MVSVTYDPTAKALYVDLDTGKKIVKTVQMGDNQYMDISDDEKPVGLEILFPDSTPTELIDAIIKRKEPIKILA